MTGRPRLTRASVVDTAVEIVDDEGSTALTLSRVARELGVKPPSLYNHISDLESLRRDVALRTISTLGGRLGKAAMGRMGDDAVRAIAVEFRAYATEHPHLYALSVRARPGDDAFTEAALRAAEPMLAALRAYELDEVSAIHAARTFRSAVHGFVSLELSGGFGIDVDVDESFAWLVDQLCDALESMPSQR